MTLAKTKPRKSTATHKKRRAQHHKQSHHYLRPYWPYLPIVAVLLFGLLGNAWFASAGRNVLGYATDMSAGALVAGTNDQRVANGLGSLALNSTLSQAAQNKANDMAARDYWSHNTPDGQAPWTFIAAVGYSYQTAGENLAYGFTTSSGTITGWMNSPGHRANILNSSFQEVGFGIANAPNYQSSGPQTIVVAMYAKPYAAPAPIPTPTPVAPTALAPTPQAVAPSTTQTAPTTNEPESTSTPTDEATAETQEAEELPANATEITDDAAAMNSADKAEEKEVSRVEVLTAANVSWSQFAVSLLVAGALLAFLLRHSLAWHKMLVRGEKFFLHHPVLDVALVTVVTLGFILLQTSGNIR